MNIFPAVPSPDFYPNFTGYDVENIDWNEAYHHMAQAPDDTIYTVRV